MTTKRSATDDTAATKAGEGAAGAPASKVAKKVAKRAAKTALRGGGSRDTTGVAGRSARSAAVGSAAHGGAVARRTPIERCVGDELKRHFDLLGDEPPKDLYRLVMRQAESSLLMTVMDECRGNQSKAATWLGISRGTLRGRLAEIQAR